MQPCLAIKETSVLVTHEDGNQSTSKSSYTTCARQFYVNMTQARLNGKEGTSIEKMAHKIQL